MEYVDERDRKISSMPSAEIRSLGKGANVKVQITGEFKSLNPDWIRFPKQLWANLASAVLGRKNLDIEIYHVRKLVRHLDHFLTVEAVNFGINKDYQAWLPFSRH